MKIVLSHNGACFPDRKPAIEDWLDAYTNATIMGQAHYWVIGDLLHMIDVFDMHQDVPEEILKKADSTLRAYTQVASKFPKAMRDILEKDCPSLGFSHYRTVASLDLDTAERWLRKAQEHGWSRDELRRAVKGEVKDDLSQYQKVKLLWHNHIGEQVSILDEGLLVNRRKKVIYEV